MDLQGVNPWAVFITAFFTALPVVLGQILGHMRQMAELKKNTALTQQSTATGQAVASQVMHAASKVDSAAREVHTIKEDAKKITDNAAAKVGTLIGKVLGDRAEKAAERVAEAASQSADRVAQVASESSAALAEKVDRMTKVVKGDDGTCLTARVDEQGQLIKALRDEMETVKSKVGLIEGDTKQILELLTHRGAHI